MQDNYPIYRHSENWEVSFHLENVDSGEGFWIFIDPKQELGSMTDTALSDLFHPVDKHDYYYTDPQDNDVTLYSQVPVICLGIPPNSFYLSSFAPKF